METGGNGDFYFQTIDNDKRRGDLTIVREAADSDALLAATRQHFDQTITSMSADRILQEFDDEQLSPLLSETIGFDPLLFKAVLLFELTHLTEDESLIPFIIEDLSELWKNTRDLSKEDLERWFTAETKKSNYVPFGAMARHITSSLSMYAAHEMMESMKNESEHQPETDPLQVEIDGDTRPWRVFAGREELKSPPEHLVLTTQLLKDLRKLYPRAIVDELDDRFPDEGTFEAIQQMIEKIQYERQEGITPTAKELLPGYLRYQQCLRSMFGRIPGEPDDDDMEAQLQSALKDFERRHRNIGARTHHREVYVLELGRWFTVHQLNSDTELNVSYRRIFYGDIALKSQEEVPLEARGPIIAELKIEQDRVADEHTPYDYWYNPERIQDVFGPFEGSVEELRKAK